MTQTNFGFRPGAAIAEKRRQKQNTRKSHHSKVAENEAEMNERSMPPWALVLYHQNKAIMAELDIE